MKIILNNVPIENHVPANWELVKTITMQASTSSSAQQIADSEITEPGLYKFVITFAERYYIYNVRTKYQQSIIAKVGDGAGTYIEANTPTDCYGEVTEQQIGYIEHNNDGIELTCGYPAPSAFNIEVKIYKAE